jgi:hypothetical protein
MPLLDASGMAHAHIRTYLIEDTNSDWFRSDIHDVAVVVGRLHGVKERGLPLHQNRGRWSMEMEATNPQLEEQRRGPLP